MNEKIKTLPGAKRGRKPLGDAPMTAAERKRASRAKLAADPTKAEFMVTLAGGTLAFVDQMAQHNNVSRSRVVQEILDMAIALVRDTVVQAGKMLDGGASIDEVQGVMRQAFASPNQQADKLDKEGSQTE